MRGAKPSLEGRRFVVGGLVTDASADGKPFKVNGIAVDASAAMFDGGTEADLANGKFVRVMGALDAGIVKASSVKFLR